MPSILPGILPGILSSRAAAGIGAWTWTFPLGALSALRGPQSSAVNGPQAFAIRVGITALVLLLALTLAPRLAARASTAPARVGLAIAGRRRDGAARPVESPPASDVGASKWLGGIVLVSIWSAAVAAVAVVWLWGRSGFLPDDPRVILTQAGYIITRVAISLLVLAVTLALGRALDTGIELALARSHVNKNLLVLAGHAIYAGTVIVGVIVILAVWGVSLVVPVTLIGVLTVALSLALQDILKNVVSGVYLLIERPFVIGDEIIVAGFTGIIEDIQIRVTHLRAVDGQLVLVPNATLFSAPVVNSSAYQRRRASLVVTLPASGAASMADLQAQILAALHATAGVRAEPAPEVTLAGFTAGKSELQVTFWTPTGDPRREGAIVSVAIEQLRRRLPDAEITPIGGASVPV